MARLIIPISVVFNGGGMTWTLEGELSAEWSQATVSRPYSASSYWDGEYVDDIEWTLNAAADDEWVIV